MPGLCGSFSDLRPRYRRLVDNIFPANPQDGLVRSNMEKLIFYALSSPEKLDRIGKFLAFRVSRDIAKNRNEYVVIAMEAMDQLLMACHSQTLNLFVESFLKMVQLLLDYQEPNMQLLATTSFIKFSNIKEDTPSYHRCYDYFICKFSSLCYNNHVDPDIRNNLRVAGLRGLQGVVRKTVGDDLQTNIWEKIHMEKIIPSLLYNMQDYYFQPIETPDSSKEETHPWSLAENCLRELMGRATFGNVSSAVKPILQHFDNHDLWVPNDFAVYSFKIIMYSIHAQYSYAVIQILMEHLDKKTKTIGRQRSKQTRNGHTESNICSDTKVFTSIVNILSITVSIAAGESTGPFVFEIFNSLLNNLRWSIDVQTMGEAYLQDEKNYQDAIINTLGEFAKTLPDFQKTEIMMFIMNKVTLLTDDSQKADMLLQHILLKSLLKVGTKYHTVQMAQAFPSAFLQPLLQMSLATDPAVRLVVQQILHTLLDRHENLPKLSKPCIFEPLPQYTVKKCSKQDTMFMKKVGPEILLHIYENAQLENNSLDNFNALYTTLALLSIELGSEETLIELLRIIFALQELPSTNRTVSSRHRVTIHGLVARILHLIAQITAIPVLCTYVDQVIKARVEKADYLLPGSSIGEIPPSPCNIDESLLFDKAAIAELLHSVGQDTSRLLVPYAPRQIETVDEMSVTHSISDLSSTSVGVDRVSSLRGVTRKRVGEEMTVESLRKMMAEPHEIQRKTEEEIRLQIFERFRTAPFEDLVAKSENETDDLQNKLNEIFGEMPSCMEISSGPNSRDNRQIAAHPVFTVNFPDLFVF